MKKYFTPLFATMIILLSMNSLAVRVKVLITKNTDELPLRSLKKTSLVKKSGIINIWAGSN